MFKENVKAQNKNYFGNANFFYREGMPRPLLLACYHMQTSNEACMHQTENSLPENCYHFVCHS